MVSITEVSPVVPGIPAGFTLPIPAAQAAGYQIEQQYEMADSVALQA